jgi:hypothetical protein
MKSKWGETPHEKGMRYRDCSTAPKTQKLPSPELPYNGEAKGYVVGTFIFWRCSCGGSNKTRLDHPREIIKERKFRCASCRRFIRPVLSLP